MDFPRKRRAGGAMFVNESGDEAERAAKHLGHVWQAHSQSGDKKPVVRGMLDFDEEVIDYLFSKMKSGSDEIKLELAGWGQMSKAGKPYLQLKLSVPFKEKQKQRPQSRQAPSIKDDLDDEIPWT